MYTQKKRRGKSLCALAAVANLVLLAAASYNIRIVNRLGFLLRCIETHLSDRVAECYLEIAVVKLCSAGLYELRRSKVRSEAYTFGQEVLRPETDAAFLVGKILFEP